MISLPERQQIVQWVTQANTAGARAHQACELLGIAPRTLQRWQQCGELLDDARRTRCHVPANKLSDQEREQFHCAINRSILMMLSHFVFPLVCNSSNRFQKDNRMARHFPNHQKFTERTLHHQ